MVDAGHTEPTTLGSMSDETSNLIIEHLKALRAEVASVKADTSELRTRLGHVETGIAGLRRDFAHADENTAILGVRLDRLIEHMERLEKRPVLA